MSMSNSELSKTKGQRIRSPTDAVANPEHQLTEITSLPSGGVVTQVKSLLLHRATRVERRADE